MTEKWCACFNLKGSMRGHGVTPGRIISLSIKKLAEKAKSPPCQPRLSQGPLCAPWQPQAVREQIRHSLPAPGCQRVIKVHLGSPRLSQSKKMHSDSSRLSQRDRMYCQAVPSCKSQVNAVDWLVQLSENNNIVKLRQRVRQGNFQQFYQTNNLQSVHYVQALYDFSNCPILVL